MPSVQYYNQTAPFWDFIASMEEQGASHPFFAGNNNNDATPNNEQQRGHPITEGWPGAPWGAFHPSGRHGPPRGHHHHHHPPPPPPPPPPHDRDNATTPAEKEHDPEEGSSDSHGPPPPFSEGPTDPHHERGPHRGPGSRRGRCGGRGGWGGRGRGGPFGFPGAGQMSGLGGLAEMFQSQLFGQDDSTKQESSQDFKPEADVFDTADSFVIHISLPGAKKEDVSVSWDAESSQLIVAGVVHRPGDEELLKTLALDERKVGAFERKVRLGSRANPAQVESDGISAKLEDGVLRIDVPKLDSGYVEIKKVDIE